jgi:hypothetical protein
MAVPMMRRTRPERGILPLRGGAKSAFAPLFVKERPPGASPKPCGEETIGYADRWNTGNRWQYAPLAPFAQIKEKRCRHVAG